MARVELRLSALPAHVRTSRLVGVAAARRAGLGDDRIDELRLAIGEACSRAVGLHAGHAPGEPVLITIDDNAGGLLVRVTDRGPAAGPIRDDLAAGLLDDLPGDGEDELVQPDLSLALLRGLVDDVDVEAGPNGTTVTMRWPLATRAGGGTGPASTSAAPD